MYTRRRLVLQLIPIPILAGVFVVLFILFQTLPSRTIDIGVSNDIPFITGFFLPEKDSTTTFRWSSADAALILPGASDGNYSLAMRLNGDLRVQRALTQIDLIHASTVLGHFDIKQGWRVYRVLLPTGVMVDSPLIPAHLSLHTTPINHEQRALGMPVDWVKFDPLTFISLPINVPLQRTALFLWGFIGIAAASWTVDQWLIPKIRMRLLRIELFCISIGIVLIMLARGDPYLLCWYLYTPYVVLWGLFGIFSQYILRMGYYLASDKGEPILASFNTSLSKPLSYLWWYTLYVITSICFVIFYFSKAVEYEDATFQLLTSFNAFVPYQYRILLPALVKLLTDIVPISLYIAYICTTIICVFFVLIMFRLLLSYFIQSSSINWYCLFVLYPMTWNYAILSIFIYPSDIVAILLFITSILCILQQKWRWYYLIFILAAFNRETSCFITFAFLFVMLKKKSNIYLLIHCIIQFSLWILVRGILTYLFRDNFGNHVFQNQITNNYLFLQDIIALKPFALARIGMFGGIWIIIPFIWREQLPLSKRLLWVVVPFIVGMSVVGLLYETRIYSELIPILSVAIIYSLHQFIQKIHPHSLINSA